MGREGQAVTRWFGAGFARLHPLLQRLHEAGGSLSGTVTVSFGRGLGGWIGRKLAAHLGLRRGAAASLLRIRISADPHGLVWTRILGEGPPATSTFTPVGAWPEGYWLERSGPLTLQLGVDTSEGGWRWILKGARLYGVPLPTWLAPRIDAGKFALEGRYRFRVRVSHALLGPLFSYEGDLTPDT